MDIIDINNQIKAAGESGITTMDMRLLSLESIGGTVEDAYEMIRGAKGLASTLSGYAGGAPFGNVLVRKYSQELQELDDQGAIIEEGKVGKDDAFDHRVRNDGVQPPREHVDASKQEPEASPFLLSFLIFVQVMNRHKERWDEHEIRVETMISEERVQNTEHDHRETHCDVVEGHVNLFFHFLELLYALQPK